MNLFRNGACHPDGLRFLQAGGPMQPDLHERCGQSCMGPPAPKNGAIRMTTFSQAQVRHIGPA